MSGSISKLGAYGLNLRRISEVRFARRAISYSGNPV
jgi:hypothetical protein